MENLLKKILDILNPQTWINKLWEMVQDFYYWVVQSIIDTCTWVLSLISFPDFELPPIASGISSDILSAMNWVFPFQFLYDCVLVFIASTIAYFTIGVLLRWIKVSA